MSALGLGRVKTLGMLMLIAMAGCISGDDRGDQRSDPDDVHDPCQIVGQNR